MELLLLGTRNDYPINKRKWLDVFSNGSLPLPLTKSLVFGLSFEQHRSSISALLCVSKPMNILLARPLGLFQFDAKRRLP